MSKPTLPAVLAEIAEMKTRLDEVAWQLENLYRYGMCLECGMPRRPVMLHDGKEPSLESMPVLQGGTWEYGLVCGCHPTPTL